MAGLFDQGRERAKRLVDKVAKAARSRDSDQPVTVDSRAEPATGQHSATAKKPYAFTAVKRALDDTDTLLLKLNSMRKDSDMLQRDQGAASPSASASKADQLGSSSKQEPMTEGLSAWDLPLSSFQKAAISRPLGPANTAVQMTPQLTASEDDDQSATTDSQQQSITAAAVPEEDASTASSTGPNAPTAAGEVAALGAGPNAGSKGVVFTRLKEQLPASSSTNRPAGNGSAEGTAAEAAAAADTVPVAATAVQESHIGSLDPFTLETAAPSTAAPAASVASSAVSSRAGSSEIDAVLEVQPQPASTACVDSPVHSDHGTAGVAEAPQQHGSIGSSSKAPSSVSRPGVVDAANLIAPGLVAKRRAAAIAAVESKAGPSPELQASPVIETEGKADTKSKSHVTLSMW